MKLGVFMGKEEYKAIILDIPVKGTSVFSFASTDLSKVKEFILRYKKSISTAGIFISDYYTEYFINEFKGAKDEDLEKLIKFKIKDLSIYKEGKVVLGFQAVKKGKDLIKTVSAITGLETVKQAENFVNDLGIKSYSITPSVFPLLNLCNAGNFALVCSMDKTLTVFFGDSKELNYIRKTDIGQNSVFGLPATFKYYREAFKDIKLNSVFTIGPEIQLPERMNAKEIAVNTLIANIDTNKLAGFEVLIGGLLNL